MMLAGTRKSETILHECRATANDAVTTRWHGNEELHYGAKHGGGVTVVMRLDRVDAVNGMEGDDVEQHVDEW